MRLERHAEHGDLAGALLVAERVEDELHDPLAAAQVDRVDLLEEGDRLPHAELLGTRLERADVLRQTAAAEADPGIQELPSDPRVIADRIGERRHVRAGHLGDLGHRVDERDLRREERVRRDLHELRGRIVGDDERRVRGEGHDVHLVEDRLRAVVRDAVRPRGGREAVDETVRRERVRDGEALTEELGVPREIGRGLDLGEARREACRGADRDGRLAGDERAGTDMRDERLERRVDVPEVGPGTVLALRRPHREEVDVGVRRRREVGREAQSTGRERLREELGQAGLEERRDPRIERRDLRLVDVDADDIVPELGHRGRVDGAEVAGADDGDAHASSLWGSPGELAPSRRVRR